jgi:predicted Kef-type K+ transport protein
MAGVTFREAARKKMLWMALAAGGAFLVLFGIALHFQARDLAAQGVDSIKAHRKFASPLHALSCRFG